MKLLHPDEFRAYVDRALRELDEHDVALMLAGQSTGRNVRTLPADLLHPITHSDDGSDLT